MCNPIRSQALPAHRARLRTPAAALQRWANIVLESEALIGMRCVFRDSSALLGMTAIGPLDKNPQRLIALNAVVAWRQHRGSRTMYSGLQACDSQLERYCAAGGFLAVRLGAGRVGLADSLINRSSLMLRLSSWPLR